MYSPFFFNCIIVDYTDEVDDVVSPLNSPTPDAVVSPLNSPTPSVKKSKTKNKKGTESVKSIDTGTKKKKAASK